MWRLTSATYMWSIVTPPMQYVLWASIWRISCSRLMICIFIPHATFAHFKLEHSSSKHCTWLTNTLLMHSLTAQISCIHHFIGHRSSIYSTCAYACMIVTLHTHHTSCNAMNELPRHLLIRYLRYTYSSCHALSCNRRTSSLRVWWVSFVVP